jgi:hypothetical protein
MEKLTHATWIGRRERRLRSVATLLKTVEALSGAFAD